MNYEVKNYLKKAVLGAAGAATMIWCAYKGVQGLQTPVHKGPESIEIEKEDMIYISHPATRQKYQIQAKDNITRRNFIARIEREKQDELAAHGCYRIDDYLESQIDEFIDDKTSYPDLGVLTRREILDAMSKYEGNGIQFVYPKRQSPDYYEEQQRVMRAKAEMYKQREQAERERYRLIREQKLLDIQKEQRYLMGQ